MLLFSSFLKKSVKYSSFSLIYHHIGLEMWNGKPSEISYTLNSHDRVTDILMIGSSEAPEWAWYSLKFYGNR
jgi:hypothetical protein